jgi:hypothetical protein
MFRPTLFISAVLLVLFSSLLVPMTSAQTATPPDYQIYLAEWRADGESVLLTFSVYNRGGASSQIASVEVTDRLTGQVIIHAEGVIPPLATGSIHSIALDLDITRYPSGSTQQIEIIVARPEISAGVLPIMSSNSQALSLLIPAHGGNRLRYLFQRRT